MICQILVFYLSSRKDLQMPPSIVTYTFYEGNRSDPGVPFHQTIMLRFSMLPVNWKTLRYRNHSRIHIVKNVQFL